MKIYKVPEETKEYYITGRGIVLVFSTNNHILNVYNYLLYNNKIYSIRGIESTRPRRLSNKEGFLVKEVKPEEMFEVVKL